MKELTLIQYWLSTIFILLVIVFLREIIMRNSFLRSQDYQYRDTLEKELTEEQELPKFKKTQDDYRKRIKIQRPAPPPPPPPVIQVVEQPLPPPEKGFFQGLFEKYCGKSSEKKELQICEQCLAKICSECHSKPERLSNCRCINLLCRTCDGAIRGERVSLQLRSYPIKIRQVDSMHF